jgi:high-affinity nickel-transport protein
MSAEASLLLASAIALGCRHGLDWDHIAAVMDIVGTTTAAQPLANSGKFQVLSHRSVSLSSFYALGHATAVFVIGLAVILCAAALPPWLTLITGRVVGLTLLLFGISLSYLVFRSLVGGENFKFQSRWMFLLGLLNDLAIRLQSRLLGTDIPRSACTRQYCSCTAFGVGVIHGIGAETGTQVLLLVAVGGTNNHVLALAMLAAFVTGFCISNTIVACLGAAGLMTSKNVRPVYLALGTVTALLSLSVGTSLLLGAS